VLVESISGPTLLRPYIFWRTGTPFNAGGYGNKTVDAALDRVRHAPSEDSYKEAVLGLEQAFVDDPPAIFIAWSVRARAVSKRFDVPVEEGRDILGTLRLWRPMTEARTQASRN
jgi:ABC-type transport system substrate-binding protein